MSAVLDYLPRGNTLSDQAWRRRHLLLQWILLGHLPALFLFGLWRGFSAQDTAETLAAPLACLLATRLMRSRRPASLLVTAGLVYCSAALVGLSGGSIEAHFHFFIMIGFIALYQDWVPFLWNILFTVLSHGIGSSFVPGLIFNHAAGQAHPWTWSLVHGVAVLAACVGVVLFWKNTEDEQSRSLRLTRQLTEAELSRRRFTSELLVNLARRNQNLLYRQLDLLNNLEEKEHDPDALADLFRLDHLATRIRRNAESLLVLSGEEAPRTWGSPVLLVDVVRAAIAEIEDLDRVDFAVDESLAVSGRAVADVTHLLAELLENSVHFSPPGMGVMLRTRPYLTVPGAQVLTIEDWGIGMDPAELAVANELLRRAPEVDLSVSQRLGLHVVARLGQRYGVAVSLTPTPGGGITAVAVLPAELFAEPARSFPGPAQPANQPAQPFDQPARSVGEPPRPLDRSFTEPRLLDRPARSFAQPARPVAEPARSFPGPAPVGVAVPALAGPPAMAPAGALPRRSPGATGSGVPAPFQPAAPALDVQRGPATATRPGADISGWSSWWTPHQPEPVGVTGQSRSDVHAGQPATARPDGPPAPAARQQPAAAHPDGPPASTARQQPPPEPPAGPGPDRGPAPPADPPPFPRPPTEDRGGDPAERPRLSRRVPQAHLAAGLRRDGDEVAEAPPPAVRDPLTARDALSRFQASQRAAREEVDRGDAPPTGLPERSSAAPERPTGGPEQSAGGTGPTAEPERRTPR